MVLPGKQDQAALKPLLTNLGPGEGVKLHCQPVCLVGQAEGSQLRQRTLRDGAGALLLLSPPLCKVSSRRLHRCWQLQAVTAAAITAAAARWSAAAAAGALAARALLLVILQQQLASRFARPSQQCSHKLFWQLSCSCCSTAGIHTGTAAAGCQEGLQPRRLQHPSPSLLIHLLLSLRLLLAPLLLLLKQLPRHVSHKLCQLPWRPFQHVSSVWAGPGAASAAGSRAAVHQHRVPCLQLLSPARSPRQLARACQHIVEGIQAAIQRGLWRRHCRGGRCAVQLQREKKWQAVLLWVQQWHHCAAA